jgi:integrase
LKLNGFSDTLQDTDNQIERRDVKKERPMVTVLNFNKFVDKPKKKKGKVTKKSGSNKLYVDFYYHGVRIVKSTGLDDTPKNQKKVRDWLDRATEKIEKGAFVFAEAFPGASAKEKSFHARREGWEFRAKPQDVLFEDYVADWTKRFLLKFHSKSKRRDFKQVIDYWLLPYFTGKTFFHITGVALKEFIPTLVRRRGPKKGQSLSASRIRNILIPLRAIWGDANEEYRWDLSDPFTYVKKCLPKRSKKHPEVFRFDEWMQVIQNIDPFYRPIAETMIMTGMIGSEIAGLRRKDILGDHISIRNSIVRKHEKSNLKTEYRSRRLPITTAIRTRLETVLGRSNGKYVFGMKSGRIFDVDSFRKNPWTTAFKKAGMQYKVPYTIRHTFAAWALTLRLDPNRLVALMGHGSKKMIYEVYGNYVEGLEADAGKIFGYFGKDFIGLKDKTPLPFPINFGESAGESQPR